MALTLRMTPSGIVLLPTKDEKPMQEPDYLALSAAEKKNWRKTAARSKRKSRTLCAKAKSSSVRSPPSWKSWKPKPRIIWCAFRLQS